MPQRTHRQITNVEGAHVKELQLLYRPAMKFFNNVPCSGSLYLEAPAFAMYSLAHRARRRSSVGCQLNVIVAVLSMEHQPVGDGCAPNVSVLVLFFVEDDPVTDDMPGRCDRDILLSPIDRKVFE